MKEFIKVNIFTTLDFTLGKKGDATGKILETEDDCEDEALEMIRQKMIGDNDFFVDIVEDL